MSIENRLKHFKAYHFDFWNEDKHAKKVDTKTTTFNKT